MFCFIPFNARLWDPFIIKISNTYTLRNIDAELLMSLAMDDNLRMRVCFIHEMGVDFVESTKKKQQSDVEKKGWTRGSTMVESITRQDHPEPSADENIHIIRSDAANLASLIIFVNFAAEGTKQGCGLDRRYLHDDSWRLNFFSGSSSSHCCQPVTSRFNRLGILESITIAPISSRSRQSRESTFRWFGHVNTWFTWINHGNISSDRLRGLCGYMREWRVTAWCSDQHQITKATRRIVCFTVQRITTIHNRSSNGHFATRSGKNINRSSNRRYRRY